MSNNSNFFGIFSPRDMLEKAIRDYYELKNNLCTDTIFNFFVTAYHIMEHVKVLGTIDSSSIEQMYKDEDFKMCRYICNKGKHAILKETYAYDNHADSPPGAGGKTFYTIIVENERIHVEEIAERLIEKWEFFFKDNRI